MNRLFNQRMTQLLDLVVALDVTDELHQPLGASDYQTAAQVVSHIVRTDLGALPMRDFVGPVAALQTIAENIYSETHGFFADLDGSGRSSRTSEIAECLFGRLRKAAMG